MNDEVKKSVEPGIHPKVTSEINSLIANHEKGGQKEDKSTPEPKPDEKKETPDSKKSESDEKKDQKPDDKGEKKDETPKDDDDVDISKVDVKALLKEHKALKKKLERTEKATQERIDAVIAQKKVLEHQLAKATPEDKTEQNSETKEIDKRLNATLKKLSDNKKKERKLLKDLDNADADDLETINAHLGELDMEQASLNVELLEIKGEYKGIDKKKEDSKLSEEEEKSSKAIAKSWNKVLSTFPELLANKETGEINTKHPLWKKTLEILTKDGVTPKFDLRAKKARQKVNPDYDHANGPYSAALEAFRILSLDEKKSTDKKKKEDKDKETDKKNFENQVLDNEKAPENQADVGEMTKLDREIEKSYDEAMQDPQSWGTGPAFRKWQNLVNKKKQLKE